LHISPWLRHNQRERFAQLADVEVPMIRSIFASVGFTFACMGIGLFSAIGIWIWSVKAEVNRQSETLSSRANKTLDSADLAIGYVRDVIGKAEGDLAVARLEAVGQGHLPQINPIVQFTAQKASQDLAGSVERANSAIVAASEAVVVADAALDVIGGVPELKQLFGVKPEQLEATRSTLGNVSSDLLQARGVLGIQCVSPDSSPTNEQLHAVDGALRQARGFTDEVGKVVESTRTRVNETKQTVDLWAWRGAVGTSVVSALGAIGQLFMACFFWRLLRRQSAV
jgi:hydrogenase maturation protease